MTDKEQEELFQKGLLQICQELHMTITGSYMDLLMVDQTKYVDYLRYRLDEWGCSMEHAIYDLRVKDLITTVIDEYDDWLEHYKPQPEE